MSNRALLANGRIIDYWDIAAVEARLIEAADTLRRLHIPGIRPAGHRSAWPDVIRDFWDMFGYHETELHPSPPSPQAIGRMDETMTWPAFVDAPLDRRIVWAKAFKLSNRKVALITGQNRETVRRRHKHALADIVAALNANAATRKKAR